MAKKFIGNVASSVQDKTIIVSVSRRVTHPIYGKQYTITKRFAVHDEKNEAAKGDRVEIVETRPISRNKKFVLGRIIERSHGEVVLKDDVEAPVAQTSEETAS
ncbi:30S ribosomal protein S17 [Candidatus Saccharibacteria bacterium]|nr:30S ribosomal protein S17 [Candidatus Saccharibacteria bacterium]